MVSRFSNEQMLSYWNGHGFEEVILIDAKDFDDSGQDGAYVDSTRFSLRTPAGVHRAQCSTACSAPRQSPSTASSPP